MAALFRAGISRQASLGRLLRFSTRDQLARLSARRSCDSHVGPTRQAVRGKPCDFPRGTNVQAIGEDVLRFPTWDKCVRLSAGGLLISRAGPTCPGYRREALRFPTRDQRPGCRREALRFPTWDKCARLSSGRLLRFPTWDNAECPGAHASREAGVSGASSQRSMCRVRGVIRRESLETCVSYRRE